MGKNNIGNLKSKYDSIHHISIAKVVGGDWITIDGISKEVLVYLHDADSGEGCGIYGSLSSPKWVFVGERNEVFQKYISEIYSEFKELSNWNDIDVNFISELVEGSWNDDISDFEFENKNFTVVEANSENDLTNYVEAIGVWILSRDDCSASFDKNKNLIVIDGEALEDVFNLLLSNDRQHGYLVKQKKQYDNAYSALLNEARENNSCYHYQKVLKQIIADNAKDKQDFILDVFKEMMPTLLTKDQKNSNKLLAKELIADKNNLKEINELIKN